MRQRIYLVVDRFRVRSMAKKHPPRLAQGQRVVSLYITVPDSVFQPTPLNVVVEIPEGNVGHPDVTVRSIPPPAQEGAQDPKEGGARD